MLIGFIFSKLKVKIYAFCVLFHTDISTAYVVFHKTTEKIKSTKIAELFLFNCLNLIVIKSLTVKTFLSINLFYV